MAQATSSALDAFLTWWIGELRAFAPKQGLWGASRKPAAVILRRPDGHYEVAGLLPDGALLSGKAGEIAEAIKFAGDDFGPATLRLPAAEILTLTVEIPEAAMRRARDILALELESSTPFSANETTFDFLAAQTPKEGKQRVRQFIVKNRIIEPIINEFRQSGVEIARIDAEGAEGINLLPASLRARKRTPLRWEYALMGLCLAVTLAAWHFRQERIISQLAAHRDSLLAETVAVRAAAAEANAAAANADLVRSHGLAYPLVLSTLASLTEILDESVWLTELSISGRDVAMSGYAASAPKVIADLEASLVYSDAAFTSAVFTDQATDLERFSAKVRVEAPSAPGSAGEK